MANSIMKVEQQTTGGRYNQEQIQTIKNTVAKGATDDELKMFIGIAQKYDLDPFIKEIWFIKRAKKVKINGNWDYKRLPDGEIDYTGAETMIMTSRDGYLKVAQRDSNFDGIIGFPVKEGDTFEIDAQNYTVNHKFGVKRGKIIGAWAKASHKSRKPVIVWADFTEYYSESTTWKQYPSAMIQKVAEVLALKRQFGINGLVTKEEMIGTYNEFEAAQQEGNKVIEVPLPEPEKPMMTKEQKAKIWELAQAKGMTVEDLKAYTMKEVDTPLTALTFEQAETILNSLQVREQEVVDVDLTDVQHEVI